MRPIRTAFATVPGPMRAPSAQARTSTQRAMTMFAVPNDSDVCSETPWLSTSHGESPSPDSSRKHDPEREQEQADDE